jgi:hypothetical protein
VSDLPELRQIVLLTDDLDAALAQARAEFHVPEGTRDVAGMAAIGFVHEVFGFDRTYVEICQPVDPDSPLGRKVAANGGSGFMVVVQVDDSAAMLARAAELGLQPLFVKDFHGSPISQWHPRDFGTIAEFDEMRPADSWHLAPAVYQSRGTGVVEDIVAIELSVAEPTAMAARWAAVIGAEPGLDGTSITLGSRAIRFTSIDGATGLVSADCRAHDRSRVGERIRVCGVDFRLV